MRRFSNRSPDMAAGPLMQNLQQEAQGLVRGPGGKVWVPPSSRRRPNRTWGRGQTACPARGGHGRGPGERKPGEALEVTAARSRSAAHRPGHRFTSVADFNWASGWVAASTSLTQDTSSPQSVLHLPSTWNGSSGSDLAKRE